MSSLVAPPARPIVLVVDDVAADRELLEGHLDQLGYDVRQARLRAGAGTQWDADLVGLFIDLAGGDLVERVALEQQRIEVPVA